MTSKSLGQGHSPKPRADHPAIGDFYDFFRNNSAFLGAFRFKFLFSKILLNYFETRAYFNNNIKRLLSLYNYQKYLQPKFIFEFGAIFCFKTFRIFGKYVLLILMEISRVEEETKPPSTQLHNFFCSFQNPI